MNTLLQDLRYRLRTFLCNPAFFIFAAAMLALGVPANTVIFTIVQHAS